MPSQPVQFCDYMVAVAKHWSAEEPMLESLECVRETMRNVVNVLGFSDETKPLSDLWCQITTFQVKLQGLDGEGINIYSMGCGRVPPRPLDDFVTLLAPGRKSSTRLEVQITMTTLQKLFSDEFPEIQTAEEICRDLLRQVEN